MSKFGHNLKEGEVEQIMKLVDTDGNGLIDFNEFLNIMDGNSLFQNCEKELENLFNMFDINKDGYITENEIKKTLKNLGEKIKKKDIRKMIKAADVNRDGKISFPEFKSMVETGNFL